MKTHYAGTYRRSLEFKLGQTSHRNGKNRIVDTWALAKVLCLTNLWPLVSPS